MKKLLPIAEKIILAAENSPANFWSLLASFISLIVIRILAENWIAGAQTHKGGLIFYEFFDSFLIAYLVSLILIHTILKIEFRKAATVLMWGYSVIIVPPIVDYFMSGGKGFLSFYTFDNLIGLLKRFVTFFGNHPDIGITYGVRTEIFIAVTLAFVYAYLKSRNILKSCIVSISIYSVLFILGTFPSWATIAVQGIAKGWLRVTEIDAVQMFFSPFSLFSREVYAINDALITKVNLLYILIITMIVFFLLFRYQQKKFFSFLHNVRFPQILYHGGMLTVGVSVGLLFSSNTILPNFFNILGLLVALEAVIFSWLASVVVNDICDEKIDARTNSSRPLIQKIFSRSEYAYIGIVLFLFALYISSLINLKFSFLLVAYQAIAWTYSAWPLRLKRFAFVSTFISSIASLMIFFSGYMLITNSLNFSHIPVKIVLLLILAYTLSLPVKDFKDIDGDRSDGVFTIPVIFGEYWGKIIVGAGIFISFLLSVLFLNEANLFWWALIFGSMSFWLVVKMKKNPAESWIHYRTIFWWILGTVFLYGIVVAKTALV